MNNVLERWVKDAFDRASGSTHGNPAKTFKRVKTHRSGHNVRRSDENDDEPEGVIAFFLANTALIFWVTIKEHQAIKSGVDIARLYRMRRFTQICPQSGFDLRESMNGRKRKVYSEMQCTHSAQPCAPLWPSKDGCFLPQVLTYASSKLMFV